MVENMKKLKSLFLLIVFCAIGVLNIEAQETTFEAYDNYMKGMEYAQQNNEQQALKYFISSAEQGYREAQFRVGQSYAFGHGVGKDYKKAVEWFLKAAEQGHDFAQYYLAGCYAEGLGIEKDYTKAVEWYQKAATNGLVNAQYKLGYCYANGYGVEKDYCQAVIWYQKAAINGHEYSQKLLDDLGKD